MRLTVFPILAALRPTGPGFDIVLLAHVACVLVGLVTITVSGVQGARLLLSPASPSLAAYFAPGTNWAGRVIYGIPLFGLALLGLSKGFFGLDDGWIMSGLALFVIGAVVAEGLLWPAERRVQTLLAGPHEGGPIPDQPNRNLRRAGWTIVAASATVVALFIAATVLMVAQP